MRRSEVSALRWADVVESTDSDGMLVTVRRSKTNQEGEVNDVRFVKGGVARALRGALRAATRPEPGDRVVPLSAHICLWCPLPWLQTRTYYEEIRAHMRVGCCQCCQTI